MIIGYSILYIDEDTNLKDTLWSRRVVYSTWDKAIEKSIIKADEIKTKYGNGISYVSVLRADSKKFCDKNGEIILYRFIYKQSNIEFGNMYIVPVYDE